VETCAKRCKKATPPGGPGNYRRQQPHVNASGAFAPEQPGPWAGLSGLPGEFILCSQKDVEATQRIDIGDVDALARNAKVLAIAKP
jgi:hypothetical protein